MKININTENEALLKNSDNEEALSGPSSRVGVYDANFGEENSPRNNDQSITTYNYLKKKNQPRLLHLPVKPSKKYMMILSVIGFVCSIVLLFASIVIQPVIPLAYSKINEFGSRYYGIMVIITSILWILLILSQVIINHCCTVKKQKCRFIYSFFIIVPILMMLIWSVIIMINLESDFNENWTKNVDTLDSWFENYYNCCGYNSTKDRPSKIGCNPTITKGCKSELLFNGYIFYSVFIGITFIGFLIEILIIINFSRKNRFGNKYTYEVPA